MSVRLCMVFLCICPERSYWRLLFVRGVEVTIEIYFKASKKEAIEIFQENDENDRNEFLKQISIVLNILDFPIKKRKTPTSISDSFCKLQKCRGGVDL